MWLRLGFVAGQTQAILEGVVASVRTMTKLRALAIPLAHATILADAQELGGVGLT